MIKTTTLKVKPQAKKEKGGRYIQVWLNADRVMKFDNVIKDYNGYKAGKETDTDFIKDFIDTYCKDIQQTERQKP